MNLCVIYLGEKNEGIGDSCL